MAKKGLVIGAIAVGAAVLAVAAISRKGEAAAPPPPTPKFTCIYGDGFTANTWEEMAAHYRTAHPDKPQIEFVEIVWT